MGWEGHLVRGAHRDPKLQFKKELAKSYVMV